MRILLDMENKNLHSINGAIELGKDFEYIKTLQKVCII